jgi:hypothetical protein
MRLSTFCGLRRDQEQELKQTIKNLKFLTLDAVGLAYLITQFLANSKPVTNDY